MIFSSSSLYAFIMNNDVFVCLFFVLLFFVYVNSVLFSISCVWILSKGAVIVHRNEATDTCEVGVRSSVCV